MYLEVKTFINNMYEKITGKDKCVEVIFNLVKRIEEEEGGKCWTVSRRWNRKDVLVCMEKDGNNFYGKITLVIPKKIDEDIMYIKGEERKVLPSDISEIVRIMKSS